MFQLKRLKQSSTRHTLPATLGGRAIGADETFFEANARLAEGWEFRVTQVSAEFTLADWLAKHPQAIVTAELGPNGTLRLLSAGEKPKASKGARIIALMPEREERKQAAARSGATMPGQDATEGTAD